MEELLKSKWTDIIELLKKEYDITNVCYKTWLLPLTVHSADEENNKAVIVINDEEIGDIGINHIKNNYNKFLQICIEEVTGYSNVILEYKTLPQVKVSSNNMTSPKRNNQPVSFTLNEKYTFDNFIVGSANKFAYAAALSVAESPLSNTNNPLFIYGGPGLGKTHLVHSIAHYIIDNSPNIRVLYVTSHSYVDEIISALRSSSNDHTILDNIKSKYRDVDVLIIDDVQFIIGKERTQEEFFNTFNELYSRGKRIILTSDKHPNQLNQLDERYKSRFNWGLPVDIQSPDYETRLAILREKSQTDNADFSDDILSYIAENITTNIRDLEGAYNKLIFRSRLSHMPITLEIAMEDIKDLVLSNEKVKITNDYIVSIVAEHYGLSLDDLCSGIRKREIALPRQMCMYLCKEITKSTDEQIGSVLKKDRSTVIHGYKSIKDKAKTDPSVQNDIDILMKIINFQ